MSTHDVVVRGRRAEAILTDETFIAAMEEAEAKLKEQWKNETSPQGREACWHKLHALDEVKRALRAFVNRKSYVDYAERQQEKAHA